MSTDAFGRPYVSRDLVCDEKERQRLIKLRNIKLRNHGAGAAIKPQPRIKHDGGYSDAVVNRLIKLREDYEAEQAQKELRTGNVTATLPGLRAPATDSVSVSGDDTPAQSNAVLGETCKQKTPSGEQGPPLKALPAPAATLHAGSMGGHATAMEMEAANVFSRHIAKALKELGLNDRGKPVDLFAGGEAVRYE